MLEDVRSRLLRVLISETAKIDKICRENPRIPTFPQPPEKIEISQLLPKSEQFRQERMRKKQQKEKAWELQKLCHEFLQDNDKDWEKRKNERLEEKSRLERIEKMKIKSKNAKIQHIEKTIEIGLNKIPEHEKNDILKEEKLTEAINTFNSPPPSCLLYRIKLLLPPGFYFMMGGMI